MSEKRFDGLMRYSPKQIPDVLLAHWNAEPKEPVHLIGEPSTVKSAEVYAFAKERAEKRGREFLDWNRSSIEKKHDAIAEPKKYFVFADVRASETDIGELRLQDIKPGLPYIVFKYNILFEALSKEGAEGVLFFDEMNLASNMVKAQFYKIINDHCIGDIPISTGVLCVSAGNEAEHARGVTEDPVPLVLRRGNYFIRPLTAEEYIDYATSTNHHPLVTGYLGFSPSDVHRIAYNVPDSVGQPCARTWTKLSNILRSNDHLTVEQIEMLANGLVGQAAAVKFAAYAKMAKKVDLDSIIAKPELINEYMKGADLSIAYAIISGVVERFRTDKKVINPAFKMAEVIEKVELGAFLLRSVKSVDEVKFKKAGETVLDDDLAEKVTQRYAKYLFK